MAQFGHAERMSEDWFIERLYMSDFEGESFVGRCCTRWLNGTKKSCYARSLELRDAKVNYMDREQWEIFVNDMNRGLNIYSMTEYASDAKQ